MTDRSLPAAQPTLLLPADLPAAIKTVLADLQRPFPQAEVELLPGAVNHDGTAALAWPYRMPGGGPHTCHGSIRCWARGTGVFVWNHGVPS